MPTQTGPPAAESGQGVGGQGALSIQDHQGCPAPQIHQHGGHCRGHWGEQPPKHLPVAPPTYRDAPLEFRGDDQPIGKDRIPPRSADVPIPPEYGRGLTRPKQRQSTLVAMNQEI